MALGAGPMPPQKWFQGEGEGLSLNIESRLTTRDGKDLTEPIVRHFIDVMGSNPQILSNINIPHRDMKFQDDDMFFVFSKVEVQLLSKPICFSVVLKFLRRRPLLGHIQGFIDKRWGLKAIPLLVN